MCDPGWSYDYRGDACYLKDNSHRTMPEAQQNCQNYGANLASINSAHEQSFLTRMDIN